ncbi:MAG: hypothetical protein H8E66_17055 [Planctomycetes bacterium]|nr:hypothetical protein [Planctomycetota bacterium]
MTNIDQFESVFKSASKPVFRQDPFSVASVLVVSDDDATRAAGYLDQLRSFLDHAPAIQAEYWNVLAGEDFSQVATLLEQVERLKPDLICTYRNLHTPAAEHPYSLGTFVDVLLQTANAPVLLAPHPHEIREIAKHNEPMSVMAITDHLAGDAHLVSVAAAMTNANGSLHLTHVEDEAVFERYIEVIGKIPSIDTDVAREDILEQLLKEPHDYISSCREALNQTNPGLAVHEHVGLGHHLTDYKQLVSEFDVDLLVLNTKDEDQLAMHGLAYPLTIEMRNQAMLLL